MADLPAGVELRGERDEEILSSDALAFVADLQRTFGGRREQLLAARTARQERLLAGELPDFLEETRSVREDDSWRVAEPPRRLSYLSTSEIADCTCPEWCERDHDRD